MVQDVRATKVAVEPTTDESRSTCATGVRQRGHLAPWSVSGSMRREPGAGLLTNSTAQL
jgi:hypothetical protein